MKEITEKHIRMAKALGLIQGFQDYPNPGDLSALTKDFSEKFDDKHKEASSKLFAYYQGTYNRYMLLDEQNHKLLRKGIMQMGLEAEAVGGPKKFPELLENLVEILS